jgi:hypothetical protein
MRTLSLSFTSTNIAANSPRGGARSLYNKISAQPARTRPPAIGPTNWVLADLSSAPLASLAVATLTCLQAPKRHKRWNSLSPRRPALARHFKDGIAPGCQF